MSVEFIDTNILVYAHDSSADKKRKRSASLLNSLIAKHNMVLSIQVLMELYVTLTQKIPNPIPAAQALEIVQDLGALNVFCPDTQDVLEAARLSIQHQLSFWDAMIVRAAIAQEATVLWTEDMNHGQVYEGVQIRNPFLSI